MQILADIHPLAFQPCRRGREVWANKCNLFDKTLSLQGIEVTCIPASPLFLSHHFWPQPKLFGLPTHISTLNFWEERFDGASRSDKGGGCCQWCDTGIASQHEGRLANIIEGFGVNSRAKGDGGQIEAPNQEVRQYSGWGWHKFDNLRVWVWDHSLRSEPQIRRWDSVWHGFDGSDSPATAATAPLLLLLPASSQNLKDFLAVS